MTQIAVCNKLLGIMPEATFFVMYVILVRELFLKSAVENFH